jgi:uncharacterized membrane protein
MALQKKQYTPIEELSIKFTSWVGTPTSIVIHTFFFIGIFALQLFGFTLDSILLILTTLVSLEAIYLAIFIQMSINRNTESLEAVEEDVEEIAKDVDEIQEDVEDVTKDLEEVTRDIDELQEDVEEIAKDVDEIQEDVEDIEEDTDDKKQKELFEKVETQLTLIMKEITELKKKQK